MEFTALKMKEMDNRATFAVGYRNLANIVVMFGGLALFVVSFGVKQDIVNTGMIIFVLGALFATKQMQANIDDLEVYDMQKKDGW